MADQSPSVTLPQTNNTKSENWRESNAAITAEQVRAIADLVYVMLLRDLKHEWERDRMAVWNFRIFKRG